MPGHAPRYSHLVCFEQEADIKVEDGSLIVELQVECRKSQQRVQPSKDA